MTPFGEKLRALRGRARVSQKRMAADLAVSAGYLSALEHGHRGRPSRVLLIQIAGYFDLDWAGQEDLERLAALSHPKAMIDTAGLDPKATLVANRLAEEIGSLDEGALDALIAALDAAKAPPPDGAKE